MYQFEAWSWSWKIDAKIQTRPHLIKPPRWKISQSFLFLQLPGTKALLTRKCLLNKDQASSGYLANDWSGRKLVYRSTWHVYNPRRRARPRSRIKQYNPGNRITSGASAARPRQVRADVLHLACERCSGVLIRRRFECWPAIAQSKELNPPEIPTSENPSNLPLPMETIPTIPRTRRKREA